MSKNTPLNPSKKLNMNSINAHKISQRSIQGLTSKIISKDKEKSQIEKYIEKNKIKTSKDLILIALSPIKRLYDFMYYYLDLDFIHNSYKNVLKSILYDNNEFLRYQNTRKIVLMKLYVKG